MKLTAHSKNRIYKTFSEYGVAKDYADVMFNYVVHGFPPGSFFTALLANDAMAAIGHSHPSNTITALKNLVTWISNMSPDVSYGSYEIVDAWCKTSAEQRREILEECGLVYSEQEEIVMILKGEETTEPFFW